jgi:hypothetical protein
VMTEAALREKNNGDIRKRDSRSHPLSIPRFQFAIESFSIQE